MEIGEGRHGSWATVELANERLMVALVPELGGRIVSLVDRAGGRDWILQGAPPASLPRIDAPFTAADAYGWDDCLPNITAIPDPTDPGGRPLRDHGDQWGRPATVAIGSDGSWIETSIDGVVWPYRLKRRVRIDGPTLHVELSVESRTERDLPILWSAHPLLALEPGARLHLPGVARVRMWRSRGATDRSDDDLLAWPIAAVPGRGPVPLDVVQGVDAGLALKLFATVPAARAAVEAPDGAWLGLSWDGASAPYLGVWLDYGGWPPGGTMHQVALEPTTAAADDLASAIASGDVRILLAGGSLDWSMAMTIGTEAAGLRGFLSGEGLSSAHTFFGSEVPR